VIVVTGIQAAGKSTIAQALAERLDRPVRLRGDLFRRMIVSGRPLLASGAWSLVRRVNDPASGG
jgi:adenylylsulfate kinase-like enzyme